MHADALHGVSKVLAALLEDADHSATGTRTAIPLPDILCPDSLDLFLCEAYGQKGAFAKEPDRETWRGKKPWNVAHERIKILDFFDPPDELYAALEDKFLPNMIVHVFNMSGDAEFPAHCVEAVAVLETRQDKFPKAYNKALKYMLFCMCKGPDASRELWGLPAVERLSPRSIILVRQAYDKILFAALDTDSWPLGGRKKCITPPMLIERTAKLGERAVNSKFVIGQGVAKDTVELINRSPPESPWLFENVQLKYRIVVKPCDGGRSWSIQVNKNDSYLEVLPAFADGGAHFNATITFTSNLGKTVVSNQTLRANKAKVLEYEYRKGDPVTSVSVDLEYHYRTPTSNDVHNIWN